MIQWIILLILIVLYFLQKNTNQPIGMVPLTDTSLSNFNNTNEILDCGNGNSLFSVSISPRLKADIRGLNGYIPVSARGTVGFGFSDLILYNASTIVVSTDTERNVYTIFNPARFCLSSICSKTCSISISPLSDSCPIYRGRIEFMPHSSIHKFLVIGEGNIPMEIGEDKSISPVLSFAVRGDVKLKVDDGETFSNEDGTLYCASQYCKGNLCVIRTLE